MGDMTILKILAMPSGVPNVQDQGKITLPKKPSDPHLDGFNFDPESGVVSCSG